MADWYDNGLAQLQEEAATETGLDVETFLKAYSWLVNVGLIDYDVEKEFIYDRYGDEEDDG